MKTNKETNVLVFHTSVRSSWRDTLSGIYRYTRLNNWKVQVIEHEPNRKSIRELLEFWQPDGVIVEGGMDEKDAFRPDVFGKIPVVFLICDPKKLKKNSLRLNHDSASLGRVAAKEFLSIGLTSFAFFGFTRLFWSEERGRGYTRALALNGYKPQMFTRRFFESGIQSSAKGDGDRFATWLKALPKPCGLFAANDLLGEEALNVCRFAGITVPEEISVLGVDNDKFACENAVPTLSSIRPNFEEAGYLCAALLGERLAGDSHAAAGVQRFFPANGVVHRQSTRRLPRANAAVSQALELIRVKACSGLRPKDVFAELDCSRRLAELRFRELTGHSVQDEIAAVRLSRVKELLALEDVPIESIAARCGWKSTARLRVLFRAVEGISLREWRVKRLKTTSIATANNLR